MQIEARPPARPMRPYKGQRETVIYHGYGSTVKAATKEAEIMVRQAKAVPVAKPFAIDPPEPREPMFRTSK